MGKKRFAVTTAIIVVAYVSIELAQFALLALAAKLGINILKKK